MNAQPPSAELSPSFLSFEDDTQSRAAHGLAPCQAAPAQMLIAWVQGCDLLILLVACYGASLACAHTVSHAPAALRDMAIASLAAVAGFVVTTRQMRAYDTVQLRSVQLRCRGILYGTAVGASAAAILVYTDSAALLWSWPLLWAAATVALGLPAAAIGAGIARAPANAARLARRVAVVGVNDYSRGVAAQVTADAGQGLCLIGLYDDRDTDQDGGPATEALDGNVEDLIRRSRRERIDAIVLALPATDLDRILSARAKLRCVPADIYMASELIDLRCEAASVDHLGQSAVIKIGSRPLNDWQVMQKVTLDFVIAALIFLAALPILALIALAIRLDSEGPVLFRQPRLGFNNNLFSVFKFRTMYAASTDLHADRQTVRGDKRITRVGRLLRKTSLDEVPQLLNVLRGEMSLVGPRPHALNTKAGDQLFQDVVADYALRHRVKPGITGWAQVNGWRGETRTHHAIEQRVAHDLFYVDNWSLGLDVRILVRTALREFLTSKDAF